MTWGIWWILMWEVASLKSCTLMRLLLCQKCIMFEPKNYRGIMWYNTEEWYKIWKRTNLCFEKWHEEFGEFGPSTQKSQNLHFNGLLLIKVYIFERLNFCRKYLTFELRNTEELWREKWLMVSKIA